jgi:hypothetical protein
VNGCVVGRPKRNGIVIPRRIGDQPEWEQFSVSAIRPSSNGHLNAEKSYAVSEYVQMKTVHSADGCLFVTHPKATGTRFASGARNPNLDPVRNSKRSRKSVKRSRREEGTIPVTASVHKVADDRVLKHKDGNRRDLLSSKYLLRVR